LIKTEPLLLGAKKLISSPPTPSCPVQQTSPPKNHPEKHIERFFAQVSAQNDRGCAGELPASKALNIFYVSTQVRKRKEKKAGVFKNFGIFTAETLNPATPEVLDPG
jgi:hypothetical protein